MKTRKLLCAKVRFCVIGITWWIIAVPNTVFGATLLIKQADQTTPPSTHFTIDNQGSSAPSIRIHRAPVDFYYIYSVDVGGPGDIASISLDLDLGFFGDIVVRLLVPGSGAPGARNVGSISLTALNSGNDHSTIGNSAVTGNLGSASVIKDSGGGGGLIDFTGGIGGDIGGAISCDSLNQLTVLGKLGAGATVTVRGDLTSSASFVGNIDGDISIEGSVINANIRAGNALPGNGANITGDITIMGDAVDTNPGDSTLYQIRADRSDGDSSVGNITGNITINGDVSDDYNMVGPTSITGEIAIGGDFNGRVQCGFNPAGVTGESFNAAMSVGGSMGNAGDGLIVSVVPDS